ncbi:MAG: hypothetical protein A4E55_00379 [Pelotomaculum sp. PtaU1.Bin035]|nr:MAG: hypothetical protein A4E55_00379 [Pelotomaculum sp. PtaU1.Bin035]
MSAVMVNDKVVGSMTLQWRDGRQEGVVYEITINENNLASLLGKAINKGGKISSGSGAFKIRVFNRGSQEIGSSVSVQGLWKEDDLK